jgi:hypothetical protein
MNAQEAEAAYRIIKGQLDARQIMVDDYNRRVAELRYQDNTGTWWAISPTDGSWLKWTGTEWVVAFAQAAPSAAPAPAPSPSAQPAQQPAAKPSWYIPPASGGQQKPAATPVVQQAPSAQSMYQAPVPQPAAVKQPWSKGKKFAIGSIVCGALAFIIFPFILVIGAIIFGILAIKEKYLLGAAGIVLGIIAFVIDWFYVLLFP